MPKQPRVPTSPLYPLSMGQLAVEWSTPITLWIGRSNVATGPMYTFGQQWDAVEAGGGAGGLALSYVVNTIGDLPATAQLGQMGVALTPTPSQGYVWDGGAWQLVGPLTAVAGPPGTDGATPTFSIGSVTSGQPQVTITGTPPNYILNFVLPEGGSPPGISQWDDPGITWDDGTTQWE